MLRPFKMALQFKRTSKIDSCKYKATADTYKAIKEIAIITNNKITYTNTHKNFPYLRRSISCVALCLSKIPIIVLISK